MEVSGVLISWETLDEKKKVNEEDSDKAEE